MARGKKKAKKVVKQKKLVKKAKRKVIPKKSFEARAKMAGVLCIKLDPAGRPDKAVIVKRLTSEVQEAAAAGSIIAVTLKNNQVHHITQVLSAKEGRFDEFMGLVPQAPALEPVVTEPIVDEPATSIANGHDRSETMQPGV